MTLLGRIFLWGKWWQQYFLCRFELDMLIERAKSTFKCTETLYYSIMENKVNIEGPIRLEKYFSGRKWNHLNLKPSISHNFWSILIDWFCYVGLHVSAFHLRCIEVLYGDDGPEVVGILRQNPIAVLPVLLRRLKQKQKEWREYRAKCNNVWAAIYARIFYCSQLFSL